MKSLQGKMAGVHITTNGGNPAEGTTVQIRGLSSLSGGVKPLIVLDGMPTENLNLDICLLLSLLSDIFFV